MAARASDRKNTGFAGGKNILPFDRSLLRRARCEAVQVDPQDLSLDGGELTWSIISGTIPGWLLETLACERLTLYQDRHGRWILAPLDE